MKNNSKSWSVPGLHNKFSSHHRLATNEVLHVVNVHDPTAALQATEKFLSIKQQRVLPGTVFKTLQKKELHHVILVPLLDVRAQRVYQEAAVLQSNAVLEHTTAMLIIRQQGIHLPRVVPEKRQKENRKIGVITPLIVKVLVLKHAQQHLVRTNFAKVPEDAEDEGIYSSNDSPLQDSEGLGAKYCLQVVQKAACLAQKRKAAGLTSVFTAPLVAIHLKYQYFNPEPEKHHHDNQSLGCLYQFYSKDIIQTL